MIQLARGFDPTTYEPLGLVEQYIEDANNTIRSVPLMAEGGTAKQSFFINSLTQTPFNIETLHLYQDNSKVFYNEIQLYAAQKSKFSSPLGNPRLRFYTLSPSSSDRVNSAELNADGDLISVEHLTLDEYLNDFQAAIASKHADGAGATVLDNFLQSFDVFCNVANEIITSPGGEVEYDYINLYKMDPSDSTKRHKIDVLVYSELPFNNINVITTKTPIGMSCRWNLITS